ncbi:MAG: Carbohydrate family 9 binding domain-like [Clostridia bacterium]|nr:Carbohydrate family 9 binding domain-like [Clostridia bacterium]
MKKIFIAMLTLCLIFQVSLSMNAAAIPLTIDKITVKPVIDGKINPAEGWGEIPTAHILGDMIEASLSNLDFPDAVPDDVLFYMKWDDTNLYYAIKVHDLYHFNGITDPINIWDGDGLQFDTMFHEGDDTTDRTRVFWGLNNDGDILDTASKVESGVDWQIDGPSQMSEFTCKREGEYTIYEAVMPWVNIAPAGTQIKVGSRLLTRAILLLSYDGKDVCDLNIPGITAGDYLYYETTLGDVKEIPVVDEISIESTETEDTNPGTSDDNYISYLYILMCLSLLAILFIHKKFVNEN